MHVVWSENFNLGIRAIDAQHRRIVDYINELSVAMNLPAPRRRASLTHVLDNVLNYTESHFSYEEAMLRQAGYPGLEEHHDAHEQFIRRLNGYIGRFAAGDENIVEELRDTLAHWFINHIQGEDVEYVDRVKTALPPCTQPAQPRPRNADASGNDWKYLFGLDQ